jgi:NAD(P)-dependent dehydrogenase (short-subunit alcohol dehydrogenase family)
VERLRGKVAIVTGAGSGIGKALAARLAADGASVVIADLAKYDLAAAEIAKATGARTLGLQVDVSSDLDTARMAEAAEKAFGRIDILVNVAGGSGPVGKTGAETTPEEFDEIVTLNMNGCFHTMRSVVPAMIAQKYGKIVNVGGTFGMRGRAGRMAYSASKWGLRGITKSFALEVGPYNINVNYVAPGMVDGPRFRDKVCADMAKRLNITLEEAMERHAADYALKRVTLDQDVANACLFLSSDVSRQITGVDLPVDGGWAML